MNQSQYFAKTYLMFNETFSRIFRNKLSILQNIFSVLRNIFTSIKLDTRVRTFSEYFRKHFQYFPNHFSHLLAIVLFERNGEFLSELKESQLIMIINYFSKKHQICTIISIRVQFRLTLVGESISQNLRQLCILIIKLLRRLLSLKNF